MSTNYNSTTKDNQSEMLTEVTQDDEVIGPVDRKECHNETRKPWHRGVHVYLFSKEGKLYLTQRSLHKDTAAGLWTVSASGHVKYGKDYKETILKEIREELGITAEVEYLDKIIIDYGSEREVLVVYVGITDKKPHINKTEVMKIEEFDYFEITNKFLKGEFDLSGGSRNTFKAILENGKLENII